MEDGRLLCEEHSRRAILSQKDAENIFYEVKRELHGILAGLGTFRDDMKFSLVNGIELQKVCAPEFKGHALTGLQGLTVPHKESTNTYTYDIYLLSGLPENHVAAVCAHEYTHVWLRENVSKDRQLDSNTIEGFCELVAYKLMYERHDEAEKRVIEANAYTRGQINTLLAAEDNFEFYRIVHWLKDGADRKVSDASLERVLALKRPSAPVLWNPVVPSPVPDTLTLKGISGSSQRRFALINDSTFEVMEKGKVRLGQTNVTLRCLEIRPSSVMVQLEGASEKKELFLRAQ